MPLSVSPRSSRIVLMPGEGQIPVYDSKTGCLIIPSDDFEQLELAQEWAESVVNRWSEKREKIVRDLLEMAKNLDSWQLGCNISTAVGSGVGIASGAAVIGGMILMPPVAIGGLIVGGVAATSNLATGVIKLLNMKKRAHDAKVLLEEDRDLLDSVLAAINALEVAFEDLVAKNYTKFDIDPEQSRARQSADAMNSVGLAPVAVASIGARLALRETAAVSSNVLKGVVHAAAGIGIALDLITVILTAKDMVGGSRCELAAKLREVAEKVETERLELHREFINHVSLATN